MKRPLRLVLLTLISCISYTFGQDIGNLTPFAKQLEFSHDNDFIMSTDHYYSSGLYFTYRKTLNKTITKNLSEQLDFSISQEVYTPSKTQSSKPNLYDRPYAGFIGLKAKWSAAKENKLFSFSTAIGIVGENSGAGRFQKWYHENIAKVNSPLWINELNNSFHINLYGSYSKEWVISPNPFSIRFGFTSKVALGSRDIYLEPETSLYFGQRNAVSKSIAYHRLSNNEKEFYVALKFAYRQVIHNGLIEGNLFGDNSPLLIKPKSHFLKYGVDLNYRILKNDFIIGVRFNTAETPLSTSHKYLKIGYARSF